MAEEYRVLVIDDEEPIRRGLARIIQNLGHRPDLAVSTADAMDKALASPPDLAIIDLNLPDGDGLGLVDEFRDHGIDATIVVLTAHGSIDSAVEATRSGVYDYLVKPVEAERLARVIDKGLERHRMHQEVVLLRREMARAGRYQKLVGRSAPMQETYRLIDLIAPSSASVLITGESGTGKEVVARTIHDLSPRSNGRFVAINCAAIPETLLESEIMGHEKGAFTGATASRPGCFELADHGTIFLDEIAEMPVTLQSKLLRVLEEKKLRRLGGTREIPVDVRVLAATNAPVEERLSAGTFREDLYFRLNVFTLTLPPLRKRNADIPLLAETFLQEYAKENGKTIAGFSDKAMATLLRYDWPGNVRELRNAIQRAVIMCKDGVLQSSDLPPAVRRNVRKDWTRPNSFRVAVGTTIEDIEKTMISETLRACGGNRTRAARMLGIHPSTLKLKLRRYRDRDGGRVQASSG
ncbi:MAG: response regulator [Candidatus Eisenbacteria bacterium]|nr:response regulator [Candidatus Latescibacterota bacterium]MBD3302103.1 response regulator [Candidatus Eisenbacteria bacterium]